MAELTEQQLADLDHAYGYHPPTPEQIVKYSAINQAAKNFERVVLEQCPSSADRTFATRQIRDARMTANRSIALHMAVKIVVFVGLCLYALNATAQATPTVDQYRACQADYRAAIRQVNDFYPRVPAAQNGMILDLAGALLHVSAILIAKADNAVETFCTAGKRAELVRIVAALNARWPPQMPEQINRNWLASVVAEEAAALAHATDAASSK